MNLEPIKRSKAQIESLLDSALSNYETSRQELEQASEIVVFGSVACGLDGPDSDLDVMAVGRGTRVKSQELDLIFVTPTEISEKWWLGSELAGHTATYGIWLKGRGSWREHVRFSGWAKRKKQTRILHRLSDVYVRRNTLSTPHLLGLLESVVLDIVRLAKLCDREHIPATERLMADAIERQFTDVAQLEALIGRAAHVMLDEVLFAQTLTTPAAAASELFRTSWMERLSNDARWRRSVMDDRST